MENDAFTLWDESGRRLYLTPDERQRFREAARAQPDHKTRTLCQLLYYTGCRISEALEMAPERIDWQEQAAIFRTLKKKGRNRDKIFRRVPLPAAYLDELDLIHQLKGKRPGNGLLWPVSRATAWRKIKGVLELAEIEGAHANPKGLRHGFGVAHALSRTPLPVLQRWMGHSDPKTTAIYMQVIGEEAHQLAGAVW